jgi:hypothetical protein
MRFYGFLAIEDQRREKSLPLIRLVAVPEKLSILLDPREREKEAETRPRLALPGPVGNVGHIFAIVNL